MRDSISIRLKIVMVIIQEVTMMMTMMIAPKIVNMFMTFFCF